MGAARLDREQRVGHACSAFGFYSGHFVSVEEASQMLYSSPLLIVSGPLSCSLKSPLVLASLTSHCSCLARAQGRCMPSPPPSLPLSLSLPLSPRRFWGENLTYHAGIGYLSGAVPGAAKGLVVGVKAPEPVGTVKLRINQILNASSRAGRKFENWAGMIGLLYAGLENGIVVVRDAGDVVNSVVAGLSTDALYQAVAGVTSTMALL
ncbi:Mitochondrial import inner membrane translocase subunit TIM23-1 [Vitis vinifera]|uniref:Mitochondrial import inner membrane translocase subunit TIM23-1 n=1 Tax=Vitis vinifera TaxID=29760 RepID=A0A438J605_VITVI|nr:Mitochondrial import inner membrane translocase subunit TIM23-1 [Vitis vinifera]